MSRRLLVSYLTLSIVVLLALEVPLGFQFARSERRDLTSKIERDAFAAGSLAEDTLEGRANANRAALQALAVRYRNETGGRIVIVTRRGLSIADSQPTARGERDFSTRPEIRRALAGSVTTGIRHSRTLGTNLLYVAVPVASAGVVHGAVRVTYPTSTLDARVHRYWFMLAAIFAVVLVAATLVGLRFARWIAGPLEHVGRAASSAGAGDLRARAPEAGPPEVRALAVSFNEMAAKLETLFDSQRSFVADASHQLRTPLTALRLRLENLAGRLSGGGDEQEVESTLAEVERLTLLVDGLLALARADSDRTPSELLDLASAARERVGAWEALAQERGVELVAGGEARVLARASADRIAQILDNLLSNALQVAPPSSRIDVTVSTTDGRAQVVVADRGPGMNEDELSRAFDRFWRASTDGDGSGLGLAIVRQLVTADGGEVELRARSGGGLEAVVRLQAGRD